LHDRGLIDTIINAAGLWSASAEQVAELLGFNPHSGGLVIPYFHPLTGQVVLNRVRPDAPNHNRQGGTLIVQREDLERLLTAALEGSDLDRMVNAVAREMLGK
jgi:hypothetical protein